MGKRMSDAARVYEYDFPTRGQAEQMSGEREPTWLERRLHEAGVFEMVASTKPPGFYVNWTTVTSLIAVLGLIGGLFYFTWNTAAVINYERGRAEAERQQMQRQIDQQEKNLKLLEEKLKQQGGQ